MNILLLDSSTSNCHVTIKSDKNWVTFNTDIPYDHTEHILRIIDNSLKTIKLKIKQIDFTIIGAGPGSFTGTRISHSLIKGLFFNTEKSILSVPSTSLFAFSFISDFKKILASISKIYENNKIPNLVIFSMIFGKKNRFYFSKYNLDIGLNSFLKPEIFDMPLVEILKQVKEDKLKNYFNDIYLVDDPTHLQSFKDYKLEKFKSYINGIDIINFFESNLPEFQKFLITPSQLLPLYIRKPDAEENFYK